MGPEPTCKRPVCVAQHRPTLGNAESGEPIVTGWSKGALQEVGVRLCQTFCARRCLLWVGSGQAKDSNGGWCHDCWVYPSWCRKTALAKRMTVYEAHGGQWAVADVFARASQLPPDQCAGYLRAVFQDDVAHQRRLCGEACVTSFLRDLGMSSRQIADQLVACEYCSSKISAGLSHCPNCGAPTAH